jgi:IS1 family transposase
VKRIIGSLRRKGKPMNLLSREKQVQIINAMVEGNSIRATARMVDVEHKTVMRVILRAGEHCSQILNERMRQLPCRVVQMDEIWTYVGKHERFVNGSDNPAEVGDQYVFVAMDSETKLIPCFLVGKRSTASAWHFVQDLESRLANRVQLTTDGFRPYINAVEDAFGANVDYAMLIKLYGKNDGEPYAPARIVNSLPIPVSGNPNPRLISTSHIERQNLTIRMQLRRFARLTNAFSKKIDNLKAALALHFAHYNFCRTHLTLRVTPAMAAGITDSIWGINTLVG